MPPRDYSTEYARRNSAAIARGFSSLAEERRYRAAYHAAGLPAPARKSKAATVARAVTGAKRERNRKDNALKAGYKSAYQARKANKFTPQLPPGIHKHRAGKLDDKLAACYEWHALYSMSPRTNFNPTGNRNGKALEAYVNAYYNAWVGGNERYKVNRNGSPALREWFDDYLDDIDREDFIYDERY